MFESYVTLDIAKRKLEVSNTTLINRANIGQIKYIRTGGGHRRYDVDKFLEQQEGVKRVGKYIEHIC